MARTRFRGAIRPPVVSTLYCRPGTMTTLPCGHVGQAVTHHVLDLQPQERRCARHVDARAGMKLGVDETRAQRMHADPGTAQPVGQPSLNETTQALEAEYVDPRPGTSPATLATLMTVPPPAVDHRRQRGVRQLHHGGDVDVQLGLQLGEIDGPELTRRAEAGVVHQHLHPGVAAGRRPWPGRRRMARSAGSTSTAAPASSCSSAASCSSRIGVPRHEDEVVAVPRRTGGRSRRRALRSVQ